jgi:hypothetical protein
VQFGDSTHTDVVEGQQGYPLDPVRCWCKYVAQVPAPPEAAAFRYMSDGRYTPIMHTESVRRGVVFLHPFVSGCGWGGGWGGGASYGASQVVNVSMTCVWLEWNVAPWPTVVVRVAAVCRFSACIQLCKTHWDGRCVAPAFNCARQIGTGGVPWRKMLTE